jgi:hypothetical protein
LQQNIFKQETIFPKKKEEHLVGMEEKLTLWVGCAKY